MQKRKMTTRALVEGAVCIAMAQVLGYLKLGHMPLGGSVTLCMLPIVLYAVRWGVGPGVLAGLAFGVLQLTLDVAFTWGWQSILGDYLLAYAFLGLGGLFGRRRGGIFLGMTVGALGRFACHYLTGATVWASSMPDTFASPWFYSLCYNGAYMGPSLLACLVVLALLYRPLGKYLRRVEA